MNKTHVVIHNFGKLLTKNDTRNKLQKLFPISASTGEQDGGNASVEAQQQENQTEAETTWCSLPGLVSFKKPYMVYELILNFDTKENEEKALDLLKQTNDRWEVSIEEDRKRKRQGDGGEQASAAGSRGAPRSKRFKPRSIIEQVTPLAHLTYGAQLEQKENELVTLMHKKFINELIKAWNTKNGVTPAYLQRKKISVSEEGEKKVEGEKPNAAASASADEIANAENSELKKKTEFLASLLPLQWMGIRASPQITGYRNNCEFTCGVTADNKVEVGFLQGSFAEGVITVADPSECLHISEESKQVCRLMREFIQTNQFKDTLHVFSKSTKTGFWRTVKVRENKEHHLMLVIQVDHTGVEQSVLDQVKQDLVEFWTISSVKSAPLDIRSMYLQMFDGVSNAPPPTCPIEKIYGEDCIHETLLGVRFQISPSSFFQVNSTGAEMLYSIAREWCSASKDETLLDVCCGTGTIGLIMSSSVKNVVGLEIVEAAVEDARKNAQLNNITNAEFVCGKAEDTIKYVIRREKTKNSRLTAIVDPPRAGLHKDVLATLMHTREIQRLVYVSCNPQTLVENALKLCGPPKAKQVGQYVPFRPVRALACDMFPHTSHCEMVVLFERLADYNTTTGESSSSNADTKSE